MEDETVACVFVKLDAGETVVVVRWRMRLWPVLLCSLMQERLLLLLDGG